MRVLQSALYQCAKRAHTRMQTVPSTTVDKNNNNDFTLNSLYCLLLFKAIQYHIAKVHIANAK